MKSAVKQLAGEKEPGQGLTTPSQSGTAVRPPAYGLSFVDQSSAADPPPGGLSLGAVDHPLERQAEQIAQGFEAGGAWEEPQALESPAAGRGRNILRAASGADASDDNPGPGAGPGWSTALSAAMTSGGERLPSAIRARMEPHFGHGFGGVRLHRGQTAGALAQGVHAKAFTLGNDVFVQPSFYAPGTVQGRRLIAHELTHVVQQSAGAPLVIQREMLGVVPPDADAEPGEILFTVPRSSSASGVVQEMRAYVLYLLRARDDPELQRALRNAYYMVLGATLRVYDNAGALVDRFRISEDYPGLPPGFYLDAAGGRALLSAGIQGNRFDFYSFNFEDQEEDWSLLDAFPPDEQTRLLTLLTSRNVDAAFLGVPSPGPGSGEREQEGAEGQWAVDRHRTLQRRLGGIAREGGDRSGIPDRVVHWRDERGEFINVWVDRRVRAIPMREGESDQELLSRVQRTTRALREGLDPERSISIDSGAEETGFAEQPPEGAPAEEQRIRSPASQEAAITGAETIANAPSYPAAIVNYGPDITVTGASNRFEMRLDYRPAGASTLSQVAARMQRISYYWELIDVTGVRAEGREEVARQTPVGGGDQATRGDAFGTGLERDLRAIGEDTEADVEDVTANAPAWVPWEARAAWLGVVGISNLVRLGGSLVSNLVSVATTPSNEQSISFAQTGDFLVRCTATPVVAEDALLVRASSVDVHPVRVQDINARALEANTEDLRELEALQARVAAMEAGAERDTAAARIAELQAAQRANVSAQTQGTLEALGEKLAVLGRLDAAEEARTPRTEREPDIRLLAVQLELLGLDRADYRTQLQRQLAGVRALAGRAREFSDRFAGMHYRPHVTFASEENGMVTRMVMMLGEAPARESQEGERRYRLVDITTESTKQVYEGVGRAAGPAGHQEAIRAAFVDFRENAGYGRGSIAIRLPQDLVDRIGGPVTVEPLMRAAPGTGSRVTQRLADLAVAAEIAGLFVAGPVGLALGAVGGIAGAIVAVDSMSRRASGNRLELDFRTIMDITAIVGGVVAPAGAVASTAGSLGRAATAGSRLPRWVRRVETVGDAVHIYGVTQMGASVIVIPVQLGLELRRIDETPNLSPGERAARRAEAFLSAVRSGVVSAVSAAQMLDAGGLGLPRRATDTALADAEPVAAARRSGRAEAPEAPEGAGATSRESGARVREEGGQARERATRPGRAPEDGRGAQRRTDLEEILGDDLRGLVEVVVHPDLEAGQARVVYRGERLRIEVADEVGSVQSRRVRQHIPEAQVMLRYRGLVGGIRQLIDAILTKLRLSPGYGTRGFEARLEVRKLNRIIGELEQMLAEIDAQGRSGTAAQESPATIQAEIDGLRARLAEHQAEVDSYRPGEGHIAADPRATGRRRGSGASRGEGERGLLDIFDTQRRETRAINRMGMPPQPRGRAISRLELAMQIWRGDVLGRLTTRRAGGRDSVDSNFVRELRGILDQFIFDDVFGHQALVQARQQAQDAIGTQVIRRGREPQAGALLNGLLNRWRSINEARQSHTESSDRARAGVEAYRSRPPARQDVPEGAGTVAAGVLDLDGDANSQLSQNTFTGASPHALAQGESHDPTYITRRQDTGQPETVAANINHAEQTVVGRAARALRHAFGENASSMSGELVMFVEDRPCMNCRGGLPGEIDVYRGPLVQFSHDFPNIRLIITYPDPSTGTGYGRMEILNEDYVE